MKNNIVTWSYRFPGCRKTLASVVKLAIWFVCFWNSPYSLVPLEDQLTSLVECYAQVVSLCWQAVPALYFMAIRPQVELYVSKVTEFARTTVIQPS